MAAAFVGRRRELERLDAIVDRLEAGEGPMVGVVSGEAGIGKTRLLEEALRSRRLRQHWLAGYEPERNVPFGAVHSLLGPLRDVEMIVLFEETYRGLAEEAPVLLVVDDLQWVDEGSAALLHYVLRGAGARRIPLGVIAGARPAGHVWALVNSFRSIVDGSQHLPLGPLGPEASLSLVRSVDPDASRNDVETLYRQAGGSPFWLQVVAAGAAGLSDPTEAVATRTRALSEDASALLALLAVVARPVAEDAPATILGWSSDRTDAAIAEGVVAGSMRRASGMMDVAHDLVRTHVGEVLPKERRRELHLAVSRWLEESAGTDLLRLVEALAHRKDAVQPVEDLALRIVTDPARRLLGAEGLQQVLVAVGANPTSRRFDEATALLATELGLHEIAVGRWDRLSAAGTPDAPSAALRASEAALQLRRGYEAQRFLQRATKLARQDPLHAIEVRAQASRLHRLVDRDLEKAAREIDAAMQMLDRLPSVGHDPGRIQHTRLRVLGAAMEVSLAADDIEATLRHSEEVAEAASGVDDASRLRAMSESGLALRLLGHNRDAEARLGRVWDESRLLFLPQAILDSGALLVAVLRSRGKLEEAEAVTAEWTELGQRLTEYRSGRAFAILLPHILTVSRGEWQRGIDGLLVAAAAEEDPHYRLHALLESAVMLARVEPRGDSDRVAALVEAAMADSLQSGCRRCGNEARLRSAEALARIRRVSDASELLAQGEESMPPADVMMNWWGARARASLALARSDADAEQVIVGVAGLAGQLEMEFEAMWATLDQGLWLVERDSAAASVVLRRAGEEANAMGARTEMRLAEQALRNLGARTWRRSGAPSGVDTLASLTHREREIASLVAGGASNPEIAQSLFLSRKTVERHISNILAKLALRNRVELAGLVRGQAEGSPR